MSDATSTSKPPGPYDEEGKPATAHGENIAMILVAATLTGGDRQAELVALRDSNQITQEQYEWFNERIGPRALGR